MKSFLNLECSDTVSKKYASLKNVKAKELLRVFDSALVVGTQRGCNFAERWTKSTPDTTLILIMKYVISDFKKAVLRALNNIIMRLLVNYMLL